MVRKITVFIFDDILNSRDIGQQNTHFYFGIIKKSRITSCDAGFKLFKGAKV